MKQLTGTIFWAVACDLETLEDGTFVPGRESRESCRKAVECWKANGERGIIAVTAGAPKGSKFGSFGLAGVMAEYLEELGAVFVLTGRAQTFDTKGEAMKLVSLIEVCREEHDIREIVICAKWWHLLKCWLLLRTFLDYSRFEPVRDIRIRVEACDTWAKDADIFRELFVGIPINLVWILRWKCFRRRPRPSRA